MVEDSTVKVCSIFGKNSSGKSNLGLALLDAINHLTDDREKTSIDANPYLNLNRNDFAEFTYYFSFGKVIFFTFNPFSSNFSYNFFVFSY